MHAVRTLRQYSYMPLVRGIEVVACGWDDNQERDEEPYQWQRGCLCARGQRENVRHDGNNHEVAVKEILARIC